MQKKKYLIFLLSAFSKLTAATIKTPYLKKKREILKLSRLKLFIKELNIKYVQKIKKK